MKVGLLVSGLGFAMAATNAQAALTTHQFISNSVNYCQAFTPGVANTIRNRAVGAENVGTATINLACNWHSTLGDSGTTRPQTLDIYFYNNTSASITVTCTMFNGYQTQGGSNQFLVTKPVVIAPGTQNDAFFQPSDNPNAGATDLGNYLVNINCSMPSGAVANDTYLTWTQDNGV